jgi:hypothetical protein
MNAPLSSPSSWLTGLAMVIAAAVASLTAADAAAGAPDKMLPATLGFTHRLGIAADIVLPGSAARVFALDGRGQRVGVVAISAAADASLFSIGPPHRTLWYEIDRL